MFKHDMAIKTVSAICGALKNKIDFKYLRKKTKEIHERIDKSMNERRERLKKLKI